jgi:IclR family acetate operon transcriptional repressor
MKRATKKAPPNDAASDFDSQKVVPNLHRALTILEHLSKSAGLGVTQIAQELKMPKNTVLRILMTFSARGYLDRDELTKQYRIGSKLLTLGHAALHDVSLVERSLDIMRSLRDETSESVLIGTLDKSDGIVLEEMPSPQKIKVVVGVGEHFPLYTAAPAKAMIAALPDAERDARVKGITFKRFNQRTITTREKFLKELEEARERGFAVDNEEEVEGIYCIGSAVLNHQQYPVGAIWITLPTFRLEASKLPALSKAVREAARAISLRYGFSS